ncbi:MAG TPA: peptidase domain-containing ABC transporter [Allosphingosinicella sp.]|jgi:ATP-binding cassette subfamily B protein RaxB
MLDLGLWKRSRVRLVRQTEIAECGLASIAMISNFHGYDVDLASLRQRFPPSLRGTALRSLMATADALGFAVRAVKVPLDDLPHLDLPAMLHWNLSHYVVLERFNGKRALIHDPDRGTRWVGKEEMSDHFTGVALEFRLTEGFEPTRAKQRLRLSQLWSSMTGLKRGLLQLVLLSLVLQAYVIASPYYMQVAIDTALPALDLDLLAVLAAGFGLFAVFYATASLLRSFVLLASGTQLAFALSVNIARRLFRLPVDWFDKRHVGDVLSRFQSVQPVQQALTAGPVSALVDGSLALFTLVVMFLYSGALALIALASLFLYAATRLVTWPAQHRAQEAAIVTAGKAQSVMIETLRGITTLRLSNREMLRLGVWQSFFADATNAGAELLRVGNWQQFAQLLVFAVEAILSTWLAARLVIHGGFSLGMMFAFMAYKLQFLTKAAALVDQSVTFGMLGLHLRRLSDIAAVPEDVSFGPSATAETRLVGQIELREIVYRYSPVDPIVLDRASLTIEPGEHIAITGPSGCGKSTLAKVILGLVEPSAGDILVDGIPLSRFGYKSFHNQVGAVLQEDSLFAGSLAENIALFDDAPDLDRVIESARAAAIHDDIAAMPMAYETLVGDMGSTLSGGQKQRVLLARALYRRPRLLLMDEATSHLDPSHEADVNAAISALGITRIVIAHRTETISAASRVFRLENGRIEAITAAPGGQSG